MTPHQYDGEFKARAVELVARKTKPASMIADELGVPCKTLDRWKTATREHPVEPFVGHGHRCADEQRMLDLERAVYDLPAENAILTKRCASSPMARSMVRVYIRLRPPLPLRVHEDGSGVSRLAKRVLRVGGAAAQCPGDPAPGPARAHADGRCRGGRGVW